MARLLSQTLIRTTSFQSIKHTRLFSNQSLKGQLIELDLDSDTDLEVLGHPKFEDAFHSIMVKQSAPDWLPFVPGSSYWVPPHQPHSHGIVSLLRKFRKPLTDEESMSLSSARGCPSSAYFIQGTSTVHPVPVEIEPEAVNSNDENIPDVKNEEG